MMKRFFVSLLFPTLLAALLTACESEGLHGDEPTPPTADLSVHIAVSRAAASGVSKGAYMGSNLGLTMIYPASDGLDPDNRYNIRWDADSVQKIRIWYQSTEGTRTMAWKSSTAAANFFVYAPFVDLPTLPSQLTKIPFKVQSDQTRGLDSSDFVRDVQQQVTAAAANGRLQITFTHQLCRLNIKILAGPDTAKQPGLQARITQGMIDTLARCKVGPVCDSINYNLMRYRGYNGKTGTRSDEFPVTTISGKKTDSTMVYTFCPTDTNKSVQECILPPQTIQAKDTFIQVLIFNPIECKHHIFVYRPLQNLVFEAGKEYDMTLELGSTSAEVKTFTITEWKRKKEDVMDLE
ncbi:MAG: fimbrillin family protein [Prevotella sp.]|nr:fimbrillin family protein [Prevotella sp.]